MKNAHWFGFFILITILTSISTRRFSSFTLGAGNVCFLPLQPHGDGVVLSPCQVGSKTAKWALHKAPIHLGILGGELLPAVPFQP